jgi:hypothetical protein
MRTHTNDFMTALKTFGREIDAKLTYQSTTTSYILTTESGDNIETEALEDLGTEKGPVIYDNTSLNRVTPLFKTELFRTVMKGVEIDCNNTIPKGTWINVQFGVKVNGVFEYIDYGNYLVYKEPQYNADTKSYVFTAYDKMIESMVKYDDNPLTVTYPITYENMIIAICDHFGWEYDLTGLVNADVNITADRYSDNGMTYRDILEDLCPSSMGNFMFDVNDTFIVKYPTETNETITDENLKDVNVTIGKKYGPVNSLVFKTADDVTLNSLQDSGSIATDGLTEINIKDNILLNSTDGENFIANMFIKLDGLEYYIYDISTTGLCIFEPSDRFTINHNSTDYTVLMLNDTTNITQGLKEDCYVDEPEETTQEYVTSTPSDKAIKKAVIQVNNNTGEVFLKVDNNGNIVSCYLGTKASKGSLFSVNADNIDFSSFEFNLSTTNLSIISDYIEITNAGIKLKNGAEIIGENGAITNLMFSGLETDLGFYGTDLGDGPAVYKHPVVININIPSDFVITEAIVRLVHIPIKRLVDVQTYWCNARKVKLYNVTDFSNLYYQTLGLLTEPFYHLLTLSEIPDAFGTNGFTAQTPSDNSHITEVVDSIDIKDSLQSGMTNMLLLQSDDTLPVLESADMYQKTGRVFATINILGYRKYEA